MSLLTTLDWPPRTGWINRSGTRRKPSWNPTPRCEIWDPRRVSFPDWTRGKWAQWWIGNDTAVLSGNWGHLSWAVCAESGLILTSPRSAKPPYHLQFISCPQLPQANQLAQNAHNLLYFQHEQSKRTWTSRLLHNAPIWLQSAPPSDLILSTTISTHPKHACLLGGGEGGQGTYAHQLNQWITFTGELFIIECGPQILPCAKLTRLLFNPSELIFDR